MEYPKYQVGISSGNLKSDYLFFDYLMPVYIPANFPGSTPHSLLQVTPEIEPGIVETERGIVNPEIIKRLGKKRREKLTSVLSGDKSQISDSEVEKILSPAIYSLSKDLAKIEFQPIPVLQSDVKYGQSLKDFSAISLISDNILDIETNDISWDHLWEFKSDKESKRALKKYRKFWYESYGGKPLGYIEDDLYFRMHELERVTKKHGLHIVETTAKAVMRENSVYSTGLAAFAGAVVTGGIQNPYGLAIGLTFALSGMAFSVSKAVRDKNEYLENSDIIYLSMIKNKLS